MRAKMPLSCQLVDSDGTVLSLRAGDRVMVHADSRAGTTLTFIRGGASMYAKHYNNKNTKLTILIRGDLCEKGLMCLLSAITGLHIEFESTTASGAQVHQFVAPPEDEKH